jgi:hypothetical protein
VVPAEDLVADPRAALHPLGDPDSVFVRPDSPLKPFAGRVLRRDDLTMKALDFGFYYDDPRLPVVIAPVRAVGPEWRYVVVDGQVVAGSAYSPEHRSAAPDDPRGAPWALASEIAAALPAPERVYVMDICESDGELRLVELNPFSGADLYACDRRAVLDEVSRVCSEAS